MNGPNKRITNFDTRVRTLTPTCDTLIYAAGDVIFDRTALSIGSDRVSRGKVKFVGLVDKDDTGVAMDIYLLKADVAFGTANATPSITDANAENIIGYVTVTPSKDLGGVDFGEVGCNIPFDITGSTLYVAAVTAGTPTYTASGLFLTIVCEMEVG